ncbi:MAG TPA: dihydroneopterin aldolase [Lentisphaeria bacterium]|nr:MAG: dihydroneopterin aldolase [Lentisphaerae bacterium GWF2_49_21]HBC87643.1 dihydroneopterin aldolase [Lentisphaeria bacterium]
MDKIIIRDLKIPAIIGTYGWERKKKQNIILNIEISCDLRKAGRSDNLEDTINYKTLKKQIIDHIRKSKYFLIEKAAGAVAELCLATKGVKKAKVTVDKPGALRYARSVAVEIERPV